MKKAGFLVVMCLCVGLISCKKQAPQLPSNKGIERDENKASLLIINQDLAIREDSILKVLAEKKGNFKKNEMGFWYSVVKTGNGLLMKDSTKCSFNFKLTKLDGKILQSGNQEVIIGKKQLIVGLEEGLKMLHKGDSGTFIIPWYLGYGMKGEQPFVPPYTSIIYNIKLTE